MKINILKKGDEVLEVNQNFIAVKHKNGEVDIIKLDFSDGLPRIDLENIITIGYGNNTVVAKNNDGESVITF